jgi:hypothetical protein
MLAIIFAMLKSTILFLLGRSQNMNRNYLYFFKVFSVSAFVELTSFTGKIGADGFKYLLWKDLQPKERLKVIFFSRSTDILGFLVLLSIFMLPWRWISGFVIGICLILFLIIKKSNGFYAEELRKKWKLWLSILSISMVSYMIIMLQFSLVFEALGLEVSKNSLMVFLTSHGLGALSQLPLGLGVKDFSIFYQLKDVLSTDKIIMGMLWMRMFTEVIAVFIGGIIVGAKLIKKE